MKKSLILASLAVMLCLAGSAQTTPADTISQPANTVQQGGQQPNASATTVDSPASNNAAHQARVIPPDSSLMRTLDYQKKHPGTIYPQKDPGKTITLSFILAFALIGGGGIYLLLATSLCRDLSYDPKTNALRPVKERPFSYSKVQLFWWSIIILTTYTAFYFFSGNLVAITPTIALLLGGGLATSILGRAMDNSQIQQNNTPVPIRHQDHPTDGFFIDILSDEGGIGIHRFQAVVLNLVFGFGYITAFLDNTAPGVRIFPFLEFEQWQLTLLGVSAAGYLGFKANENAGATRLERQVEIVRKTESRPAPPPTDPTQPGTPPPSSPGSVHYQQLKNNLTSLGMLTTVSPEQPVTRDVNNFQNS